MSIPPYDDVDWISPAVEQLRQAQLAWVEERAALLAEIEVSRNEVEELRGHLSAAWDELQLLREMFEHSVMNEVGTGMKFVDRSRAAGVVSRVSSPKENKKTEIRARVKQLPAASTPDPAKPSSKVKRPTAPGPAPLVAKRSTPSRQRSLTTSNRSSREAVVLDPTGRESPPRRDSGSGFREEPAIGLPEADAALTQLREKAKKQIGHLKKELDRSESELVAHKRRIAQLERAVRRAGAPVPRE